MASPFHTIRNGTNYDVASGGDTVTIGCSAPLNTIHRVIIDLSQDDNSDNGGDVCNMDVVEILDSPDPPSRSMHHVNVDLFTQQFSNNNINDQLPLAQNSTVNTSTAAATALLSQSPSARSTTAQANNNRDSNEHQSHVRRRAHHHQHHRHYQNSSSWNASDAPVPDSIRLTNTESLNNSLFHHLLHHQLSSPVHHYSQLQTDHIHNNNSTNNTATGTSPYYSPTHDHSSTGPSHSPTRNRRNHQSRQRNNRRRGHGSTSATRRGNQAALPQETFDIIHHLAQERLLHHHDDTINSIHRHHRHHHHHQHQHDGGRLLNIDNLSYEDLLSLFGNGNENYGATVTDISLLPVVTVTKDDVINSKAVDDDNNNKYCCSICLEHYQIGEQKKILPCFHNFHENCVDQWLTRNGSCPICKHRFTTLSGT